MGPIEINEVLPNSSPHFREAIVSLASINTSLFEEDNQNPDSSVSSVFFQPSTMPRKLNPISREKRKFQMATCPKKLRSDFPRRKRIPRFTIVDGSSNQLFEAKGTDFPSFQAPSCSSTCFPGEISCQSRLISDGSENPKKRARLKENKAIGGSRVELRADAKGSSKSDRRITRSYYRKQKKARLEPSIAEPFSLGDDRDFGRSDADSLVNSKKRTRYAKGAPEGEDNQRKAVSAAAFSETSCIEPVFTENSNQKTRSCNKDEKSLQTRENAPSTATLSELSCIEPSFEKKSETKTGFCEGEGNSPQIQCNGGSSTGFSEPSCLETLSATNTLNFNQVGVKTESKSTVSESVVNLACSEQLFNKDDDSEFSISLEMTFSEMEEEIFPKNSDGKYIDFSQQSISSFFDESSKEFSERSAADSSPSECFSLSLQYLQQFSISTTCLKLNASHENGEDYSDEFTVRSQIHDYYIFLIFMYFCVLLITLAFSTL